MGLKDFLRQYNAYDEGLAKMKGELLKEFGQKLRLYRRSKGYTQEELGEKAGVCYKYIGEIERGEKNPSFIIIAKIAAALDINPAYFLCQVDNLCEEKHKSFSFITPINEILWGKDPVTQAKILKVLQIIFDE